MVELGKKGEMKCSRCQEVWPLTLEFFAVLSVKGVPRRWNRWCRACCTEVGRINKQKRREKSTKGGEG